MPAQEPGTRLHRPTVHQPFADVTVNRTTSQVTAALTKTISWPTDQYGYYDVVITANTSDGFRRRYAGRIA